MCTRQERPFYLSSLSCRIFPSSPLKSCADHSYLLNATVKLRRKVWEERCHQHFFSSVFWCGVTTINRRFNSTAMDILKFCAFDINSRFKHSMISSKKPSLRKFLHHQQKKNKWSAKKAATRMKKHLFSPEDEIPYSKYLNEPKFRIKCFSHHSLYQGQVGRSSSKSLGV